MKNRIALGLASATLLAGCGNAAPAPTKPTAELTVAKEVYPFAEQADYEKGSGNLGTSETPLHVGSKIVAECIRYYNPFAKQDGDIKIKDGPFAGQFAPIHLFVSSGHDMQMTAVPVFNASPREIDAQVPEC